MSFLFFKAAVCEVSEAPSAACNMNCTINNEFSQEAGPEKCRELENAAELIPVNALFQLYELF